MKTMMIRMNTEENLRTTRGGVSPRVVLRFSKVFLGFPMISLVFSLFSRLFQPTTLTTLVKESWSR